MDIGDLTTQIRYTQRVNLAESAAIKILRMYCPWASTDQIILWRRELAVIQRNRSEDELPPRCTVAVKFWLENDKNREVTVHIALTYVGTNWMVEGDDHLISGWGQPYIKLWYQHGEFVEQQRLPNARFPFTR